MNRLPSEMFGWHEVPVGKHWKVHVYKEVPPFVEDILKPLYLWYTFTRPCKMIRTDSMFLGPSIIEEPPGGWVIPLEYVRKQND